MNQIVVACEAGNLLVLGHKEADIGSLKSYEVGCRHSMRSSLDRLCLFPDR